MFWKENFLSESDKIDQVHAMLLSAQRARRFGIFLRVVIIGWIAYGVHYLGQPEHAEQKAVVMKEVRTRFSEFVTPIVNDILGDVMKNMASKAEGNGAQGQGTPNITPEMVKAVQNSMQKNQ